MQGTASAATRSDGEVLLASLEALLLVGASDGVLEARRVGGVTGDRDVDVLVPHDGNALADVVGAVAVDGGAGTIGVGDGLDDLELAREVVELGLHVGEAVDAGDDLRSVLAEAVQDNAQRGLAGLIRIADDADGAFRSRKGLVTCQECEALGLLAQQHCAEVAVAEADLAVFGDGAGDAEGLETDADSGGGVRSLDSAALYCDGAADGVCPNSVIEADGLGTSDDLVAVDALCKSYIFALLDGGNAVLSENGIYFVNSSLIVFKQSHVVFLLSYS